MCSFIVPAQLKLSHHDTDNSAVTTNISTSVSVLHGTHLSVMTDDYVTTYVHVTTRVLYM